MSMYRITNQDRKRAVQSTDRLLEHWHKSGLTLPKYVRENRDLIDTEIAFSAMPRSRGDH